MRVLQNIHQVDVFAFTWFLRRKHRALATKLARIVSWTADGPLYVMTGLIVVAFAQWDIAMLMAAGFVVERISYKVFKTYFKRNRPPEAIPGFQSVVEPSDQFSFPSGHTSAAFLTASIFFYFFPWAGWILFPWAASVGMARITLGVHFPTDTIAGALMGSGVCYLLIRQLF